MNFPEKIHRQFTFHEQFRHKAKLNSQVKKTYMLTRYSSSIFSLKFFAALQKELFDVDNYRASPLSHMEPQ